MDNIKTYKFKQIWGSTALGFTGIGGSAMTTSETTVIILPSCTAKVYFGGKYAYTVNIDEKFMEDVHNKNVCSVHNAKSSYDLVSTHEDIEYR